MVCSTMQQSISIHAPREGSDHSVCKYSLSAPISIHAPREGSDALAGRGLDPTLNFNPRSP